MPIVSIRHRTRYRYRRPVGFGEHRMMLRPLEAFDQRLISYELDISPEPAVLRHLHDLTDACVAIARFKARADMLTFESRVVLDHSPEPTLDLESDDAAIGQGAFAYAADEVATLATSVQRRHPDAGEIEAWARRFLRPLGRTSISTLLSDLTHAIRAEFVYEIRPSGAPQTPAVTLERGRGSCRDFTVLLMEAARSLGLAARFASGYVYSGSQKAGGGSHGHTHAWARVYVPGCGWTDFDPTNGLVGGAGLIRVAVATEPGHALPLHGSWRGMRSDFIGMDVEIDIGVEDAPLRQPAQLLRVAGAG
jgi:transglutaminase-like putative cysteine protease